MRYLYFIILASISFDLTSQNWVEDFESGDLNNWKQIVGIADLVNVPTVEGSHSLRLWNFQERDNSEAILIHKSFVDDFGIYSYYARGDGYESEADFYFQYQDENNYYKVSHKPDGTENPEFVVSKLFNGIYTELYKQDAVEVIGKWVYISIERTCAGRMYISYNNNNVLDIIETDILLPGTIGLRTWSEYSYYDRIEFENFDSEVYNIQKDICLGQEFRVGEKRYNMPGSYRDTLRSSLGCDSIVQLELGILDSIVVNIDTVFCPNGFIMFDGLQIDTPGSYSMDFITNTGCDSIVNLNVTESTLFSLGPDRSICGENQVIISSQVQNSYLWSTGETSSNILVDREGKYSIEVIDNNNCVQRDTINVRTQCELKMYSPNVFTPNDDGVHDVWKPEFDILPNVFTLSIFDRWGSLLFQTEDPNESWDGRFQNIDVASDVYIWYVAADSQNFSGNVTVIR